jgi:hypothetical protein
MNGGAMLQRQILMVLLALSLGIISHAEEQYGNLLGCAYHDLTEGNLKGQTFLNLIRETIKPELDSYAVEGYPMANGDRLVQVLDLVDSKVRRQALRSVKGDSDEKIENLRAIGDELASQMASLYSAPNKLAAFDNVQDRYKLSTYVGLASCAGSHIKLADDNYAYNVHYGTGEVDKDDRTGRSFGASRIFHATDSSYSHYLKQLEKFIRTTPDNTREFVTTVMETLTNTEPRTYNDVTDHGDSVLTDFFAIWIAEQTRNLMDGEVKPHWDAALLQTTLLAASFHAGQKKIKMFYADPLTEEQYFTDTTFELAWPRKDYKNEKCIVDLKSRRLKDANLTDYIGVHYRTFRHCGRSGVNMSRKEWRRLDGEITDFLKQDDKGQRLLANVRKYIEPQVTESTRSGIYRDLAKFLISDKTPSQLKSWYYLSRNVASLLEFVREHADEITAELSEKYPNKIVIEE